MKEPAAGRTGLGFETIAAVARTVLHWMHNEVPVREGELLVLCAGGEADPFYTGDVTGSWRLAGAPRM
ncbi:hypothetical protein ACH415_33265 [Streptomyces californicus]|uniref:hypothetical protein n=1 Tax=Streptomyces californicus TaxID=67351 RepID=UPI0037A82B92